MLARLRGLPYHVICIGIYPVLALYSFNLQETILASTSRAVIFSIAITSLASLAAALVYRRDARRAALAASLCLILVLSYGHVFDLMDGLAISGFVVGRHRFLAPLWMLLLISGLIWVHRHKVNLERTTEILNLTSLALILMVAASIATQTLSLRNAQAAAVPGEAPAAGGALPEGPDVYYILMDAYSRQDVLQDVYGLDNSPFIQDLQSLGFVVPRCAQSNYAYTRLSMSSALNMNYLDALGLPVLSAPASVHPSDFIPKITHSEVRRIFEQMGYSTVTFKAVYPYLDIPDSTYYYDYYRDAAAIDQAETLNFQYLFLRTTVFRLAVEYLEFHPDTLDALPEWLASWIPIGNTLSGRNYKQYQQNLYLLDVLSQLPDLPGKKFVYAHLFITHQPFVFETDGGFRVSPRQGGEAYRDQVVYANSRLLEIVRVILEKSDPAPVIIIQGDHGYPIYKQDRLKNLNAYYLPGDGGSLVYDTITPVNTFRLILNRYFGAEYELLPDVSYYSESGNYASLEEVPSTCLKNGGGQ